MSTWLRQQTSLTLRLAFEATEAALELATRLEVRVSLVALDGAGIAIHSAHMDGAPRPAQAIALNKALTAAGFGIPTADWAARLEQCSSAVRQGLPLQPDLALFGGGEPFIHDGQVIGAIGASGASEAVDSLCAKAAVERVQTLLQR